MRNIAVLTLFPEMFDSFVSHGVVGKAFDSGVVSLKCFNPREFSADKHQTVDDRPYGGGPGMVMLYSPLKQALNAAKYWIYSNHSKKFPDKPLPSVKVIYMSPQGRRLDVGGVDSFGMDNLIIIAGRYEGVDERFIEHFVDEEWSIGDYVLSGGELPSMVLLDAVVRKIPNVVGDLSSVEQDSFEKGLLDFPHYSRPEIVDGYSVPDVLLGGNHKEIDKWRLTQSVKRTEARRPDLIELLKDS